VVEALIKGGCDMDKTMHAGRTPLYTAAEKGHREVVEALIKGGCDVDKARNNGDTPLYTAAEKRDTGRWWRRCSRAGATHFWSTTSSSSARCWPWVRVFTLHDNLVKMIWEGGSNVTIHLTPSLSSLFLRSTFM
jgi:ankyrin repeat protein